jgi:hypothetical protein
MHDHSAPLVRVSPAQSATVITNGGDVFGATTTFQSATVITNGGDVFGATTTFILRPPGYPM